MVKHGGRRKEPLTNGKREALDGKGDEGSDSRGKKQSPNKGHTTSQRCITQWLLLP